MQSKDGGDAGLRRFPRTWSRDGDRGGVFCGGESVGLIDRPQSGPGLRPGPLSGGVCGLVPESETPAPGKVVIDRPWGRTGADEARDSLVLPGGVDIRRVSLLRRRNFW